MRALDVHARGGSTPAAYGANAVLARMEHWNERAPQPWLRVGLYPCMYVARGRKTGLVVGVPGILAARNAKG